MTASGLPIGAARAGLRADPVGWRDRLECWAERLCDLARREPRADRRAELESERQQLIALLAQSA